MVKINKISVYSRQIRSVHPTTGQLVHCHDTAASVRADDEKTQKRSHPFAIGSSACFAD